MNTDKKYLYFCAGILIGTGVSNIVFLLISLF